MGTDRYADYDPFAWLYNKHWGEVFAPTALAVMNEVLFPQLGAGAKVVDLCCGTGQLARALTERGFHVTGIDGSAQMLRYARKNAPEPEFLLDDARSFRLRHLYDAVICMFDSLNHIMSLEELRSVFGCVHSALKKGGLFLFDLNLEAGYLAEWNGVFGIVESDHVCVIRNSYETKDKVAKFEATLFRLRDGWQRSDFTLLQRCYPVSEVLAALQAEGFSDIKTLAHDYGIGSGSKDLSPDSARAFFVGRA